MYRPPFTPEKVREIFNSTDSQKYNNLKKELAKIIIRYLTANKEAKKKNKTVYEKAILFQAKRTLNPIGADMQQAIELVEMTAVSDVKMEKEDYTHSGAMQLIIHLFSSLE